MLCLKDTEESAKNEDVSPRNFSHRPSCSQDMHLESPQASPSPRFDKAKKCLRILKFLNRLKFRTQYSALLFFIIIL